MKFYACRWKFLLFAGLLLEIIGCSLVSVPQDGFVNTVPILGVLDSKDRQKKFEGELISLQLQTSRGQGRVFVNLQSYHDLDTQIALKNAHTIACSTFELPCDQYDFHYTFYLGRTNLIKGQSGSSAVGYLLVKTLRREKIDPKIVMTSNLYPGGIIGLVGGVEEKIELAQVHGFSKIFIPHNALCEKTPFCNAFRLNHRKCSITGDSQETNNPIWNSPKAAIRCQPKTFPYRYPIDFPDCSITPNHNQKTHALFCTNSLNDLPYTVHYSRCQIACKVPTDRCSIQCEDPVIQNFIEVKKIIAFEELFPHEKLPKPLPLNDQFYQKQMRQFAQALCERTERYKAHLPQNLSNEDYPLRRNKLYIRYQKHQGEQKKIERSNFLSSYSLGEICFRQNIYLKALEFYQKYKHVDFPNPTLRQEIDQITREILEKRRWMEKEEDLREQIQTQNDLQIFLLLNDRNYEIEQLAGQLKRLSQKASSKNLLRLSELYASVLEKAHSLDLWKSFLQHQGSQVSFPLKKLTFACRRINQELHLKTTALNQFRLSGFRSKLKFQKQFSDPNENQFLCLYKGLELNAEINAALNFLKLSKTEKQDYVSKFLRISLSRIQQFSDKKAFPFLPYLYYNHARQLFELEKLEDAFLFAHKAISFVTMDTYLKEER